MKITNRITALLWIPALALSLAACKAGNDPKDDGIDHLTSAVSNTIYVAEHWETPPLDELSGVEVSGDHVWVYGTHDGSPQLYLMNHQGEQTAQADIEASEDCAAIYGISSDHEGGVWALMGELPEYYYEGDEVIHNDRFSGKYTLCRYDQQGVLTATIHPEIAGSPSLSNLATDNSGLVYLMGETGIYVLSSTGAVTGEIPSGRYALYSIAFSNRPYVVAHDQGEGTLSVMGVSDGQLDTNPIDLGSSLSLSSLGGGGDELLLADWSSLYRYDTVTGLLEQTLTWSESYLSGQSTGGVCRLDGDTFLCISDNALICLSKSEGDIQEEKTVLTLLTTPLSKLDIAASMYNRDSQDFRIEIITYSEDGLDALRAEIMTGNAPDIMDVSYLASETLAKAGHLENLYPYIDSDPALDRRQFTGNLLSALELDGGLYELYSGFSVFSLAGSSNTLGDKAGWQMDEFLACIASDFHVDQLAFLSWIGGFALAEYVDWNLAECSFTDERFVRLLELCKQLPSALSQAQPLTDTGVLSLALIETPAHLMELERIYTDAAFIGFPAEDSNGSSYIGSGISLAISSTSPHKEAAWDFIRQFHLAEYQESNPEIFGHSLSTNRSVLETQLNRQVDDDTAPLSRAMADTFLALIDEIETAVTVDETIQRIILEEIPPLLAGDRSSQQTAELIQNRVQTYMQEQS